MYSIKTRNRSSKGGPEKEVGSLTFYPPRAYFPEVREDTRIAFRIAPVPPRGSGQPAVPRRTRWLDRFGSSGYGHIV
jgi:hypothetical protein